MEAAPADRMLVARTVVELCAVLTRKLQKHTLDSKNSLEKSDFSPVTVGDFAVQAIITSALHDQFPDDTFVAEESADDLRQNTALLDQVWDLVEAERELGLNSKVPLRLPSSKDEILALLDLGGKNERSDGPCTWVIDPIDGTKTFMEGTQYAINCALLVNGREEIGIVACPNMASHGSGADERYIDTCGHGTLIFARREGGNTSYRSMNPHCPGWGKQYGTHRHGDVPIALEHLSMADSPTYTSTILSLHQEVAKRLGIPSSRSWPQNILYSSLMKYAALSVKRVQVVIRIFKYKSWRSNIWDHAGGVLIYEKVGGKVTDLNGKAIDFSKGRKMSENYGLVCAPSSVHAEVLQIVQDVIRDYEQANGPIPWSREVASIEA